jgi:hypothetical protein
VAQYLVHICWNPNDRPLVVEAKNSSDAKRQWCRKFGRKYDDPWCGASMLKAKKLKPSGGGRKVSGQKNNPLDSL